MNLTILLLNATRYRPIGLWEWTLMLIMLNDNVLIHKIPFKNSISQIYVYIAAKIFWQFDNTGFLSPKINKKQTTVIGGKVGNCHLIFTFLFDFLKFLNTIIPKVNTLFRNVHGSLCISKQLYTAVLDIVEKTAENEKAWNYQSAATNFVIMVYKSHA